MSMRTAATSLIAILTIVGECMAEPTLAVSGRFEYRTDAESLEIIGDVVCFYPSPSSSWVLPRPKSDKRLSWFCFTNIISSKKLLGIRVPPGKAACGVTGKASIQISNYAPYLGEGDGVDTARLVSVGNSSSAEVLPCIASP